MNISSSPEPLIPSEPIYRYCPKKREVLPELFERGKVYIAATVNEKTNSVTLRCFNGSIEDVTKRVEVKNLNQKTIRHITEGNLLAEATLRERASAESKIPYKETKQLIHQFNKLFNREDKIEKKKKNKAQRQRENLRSDRHAALAHPGIPTSGMPSGWMSAFGTAPSYEGLNQKIDHLQTLLFSLFTGSEEVKATQLAKFTQELALLQRDLQILSASQTIETEELVQALSNIEIDFKNMQKLENSNRDILDVLDFSNRDEIKQNIDPNEIKKDIERGLQEAKSLLKSGLQEGNKDVVEQATKLIEDFNHMLKQI